MTWFKKQPKHSQADDINMEDIRQRVQYVKQQVGNRTVRLVDLFALVGEDDRIGRRTLAAQAEQEQRRVLPNEIPSNPNYIPD